MGQLTLDIQSPAFKAPMLGLLFGQLEDAYRRLVWLVQDLTPEELAYRGPEGDRNNTGTLILHIAATYLWYLHKEFQGQPIPPDLQRAYLMDDESDRLPVVTGRTATELLTRHREALDQLKAYLLTRTDADLAQVLSLGPNAKATMRWCLWHMAEHSFLHQGHIRWLRQWYRDERQPT